MNPNQTSQDPTDPSVQNPPQQPQQPPASDPISSILGNPAVPPPDSKTSPDELPETTFADTLEEKSQNFLITWGKFILSWIVVPLVIVFLFQALVFQAFYVSGQSMEPTFQDGDYLVISKFGVTSKKIRSFINKNASINYKRGDVLIFHPPIAQNTFYIKRLIGLPGERVVIHDGKITIYNKDHLDGFTLNEPYDPSAITTGDTDETVDQDKFFVLGDNREPNGSYDSRAWGQLPQVNVSGRVIIRLLPLNRFMFVSQPLYGLALEHSINYLRQLRF